MEKKITLKEVTIAFEEIGDLIMQLKNKFNICKKTKVQCIIEKFCNRKLF